MRKIIIMSLILSMSITVIFSAEPGSKAMTFLNIAPNPRTTALGEAFVGLADDVSSVYWNPAGIGRLTDMEIAGNMNVYIESIGYYNLQASRPFFFGNLGLNLSVVSYGDIENYKDGELIGTISPSDFLFTGVYSRKLKKNLFIGGSVKLASETLTDEYSGTAFGIDAGLLYLNPLGDYIKKSYIKPLNFGLVIQNIGVGPKFDKERNGLPINIKFGFAYKYRFYRAVANLKDLNFALDFIIPTDASFGIRYGTEAWWYNLANGLLDVAVRLGFKLPSDLGILSALTFGAGIRMFNTQLDYALINYGDFGFTHRIGVLYRFGKIEKPIEPPPVKPEKVEEKPPVKEEAIKEEIEKFEEELEEEPVKAKEEEQPVEEEEEEFEFEEE